LGVIGGGIVGISGVLFPFLVVAGGIVIGAWLGKILSGVLFRLSVVLFGIGGGVHRLTVFVWVIVGAIYSGVRDVTIKVSGFAFGILGGVVGPIRSLPVTAWDLVFASYSGVRGATIKVWDIGGGKSATILKLPSYAVKS